MNKELPKEVHGTIKAVAYERYSDPLDKNNDRFRWLMIANKGAKIAQSHYAPIIEGKDKEIERLKAENQKIKDIIRLHHLDIMFSTRGIDMK